jgi:hypothetical protein
MEAAMTDAKHYVEKAMEFERLAKEVKDRVLKQHYALLAEEYRELAKSYARRKPGSVEPQIASAQKDDRGASGSH